ncbi:MAG: amidohydrolase family protein [Pontimonas sp.]
MILSRARRWGSPAGELVDIVIEGEMITQIVPSGTAAVGDHEVIDLEERVVTPGLWDEHVHFTLWAQHRRRVSLVGASSAQETAILMGTAVAANAANPSPDPIVVGAGYRDGLWRDQKTTALLDEATGDTPVILISVDVHSAWVNTATLRHFGISGHDEDGVITEREWFDLARRANDTDNATLDEWAMDAAKHAASRGVVGIVDLEMRYNAPDWIRRSEAAGGRYPLRVEAGVYPDDLDRAIAEGLRSGQQLAPGISVGPFKIITDGSLNTRTAHCVEPYLTVSPPEFGAMNFPPADIAAILTKAQEAGFWLAVHAIGDEANRIILDIFQEHGLRGRIEHAQLVREEDFPRFSELGIAASVQPEHAVDDRDVTDVYWADRSARAFALRRLVDSGATLALGSDAPVSPLDPWVSIAAAVTRTRDGRDPWHHEQALTVEEALRFSYRSTLEVSQPADIAVLDADPAWLMGAFGNDMAKASDALRAMPVALTVCAGVVTHREL